MPITDRPVWGADVPISMPRPVTEPTIVPMFGFGMTQFRLVHDLSSAEYEALAVPVYAPEHGPAQTVYDDAGLDAGEVPGFGPPRP